MLDVLALLLFTFYTIGFFIIAIIYGPRLCYALLKPVFLFFWVFCKGLWIHCTQGKEKFNEFSERALAGKIF